MLPISSGLAAPVRRSTHSLDLKICGRHYALSMNLPYPVTHFLVFGRDLHHLGHHAAFYFPGAEWAKPFMMLDCLLIGDVYMTDL